MLFCIIFAIIYIPVVLMHPTKVINKNNMVKKGNKCIVVCNHYSNWDPPLLIGLFCRRFKALAKVELFKNKLSGWFFKKLGAIPVDRKNMSPSTYRQVVTELKNNNQILIFPEGTRNKSGSEDMLEAKKGAILFASKTDTEIVPMLLYRKPKLFRKNYLIVGEPFKVVGEDPKKLTDEEMKLNLERYMNIMKELRKKLDLYVESKHK